MFLAERLISLVAPHQCLVCGDEGSLLCAWCLPDATESLPARCYRCKQPSPDSKTCKRCRRTSRLGYVWVCANYKGIAKQLIYKLKFDRSQAASRPMATLLHDQLPWLPDNTLIVHVPTATSRRRQRGYDQAELLARELARVRHLPHATVLGRMGQTRQVGALRPERLKQLKDAFYIRKPYLVKGAHILLVDDLVTTGATLEAAAKVLKKAGATSISAAIFAQKP